MSDTPIKRKPGRQHGSRNKTNLVKAQLLIDDLTLETVQYLEALMKNDKEFLDSSDDVPYTVRFNSIKELLGKGIANEKEKDAPKEDATTSPTEKQHVGPRVYATAVNA